MRTLRICCTFPLNSALSEEDAQEGQRAHLVGPQVVLQCRQRNPSGCFPDLSEHEDGWHGLSVGPTGQQRGPSGSTGHGPSSDCRRFARLESGELL